MLHCSIRRAALISRSLRLSHPLRLLSVSAEASRNNNKPVIFSGIQPTGVPHLGNYLGALRQWVKLQDEATPDTTLLYSIVDLHAITINQDPSQLRQWRREMLATLLAVGLDPTRSIIFSQSAVPAHSELMWMLSCHASMGYLSRMTQWKSKMSLPETSFPLDPTSKFALKLGLFSYPVLQAADILVHRATHVPVGEDQAQHLEFSRECANSFNHHYGPLLLPPETILSPAKRVMSLTDPTQKMSKSHANPKSRILITDSREEIERKLKAAMTDSVDGISYEPATRPGVSNLVEIMWHMQEPASRAESCEVLADDLRDLSMKALKEAVADVVDRGIAGVRERYREVIGDEKKLEEVHREGVRKASESAEKTMRDVRQAIGLSGDIATGSS